MDPYKCDVSVLADQLITYLYLLSADTRCSLEDLPGAMDNRDR